MKTRREILTMITLAPCAALTEHALFAGEDAARIAGKWQLSMDTPHGTVQGDLQVQQDGSKITGNYAVEHIGTMALSGKIEGNQVSLKIEVPGGEVTLSFTGTVEGEKMSGRTELGGSWTARR